MLLLATPDFLYCLECVALCVLPEANFTVAADPARSALGWVLSLVIWGCGQPASRMGYIFLVFQTLNNLLGISWGSKEASYWRICCLDPKLVRSSSSSLSRTSPTCSSCGCGSRSFWRILSGNWVCLAFPKGSFYLYAFRFSFDPLYWNKIYKSSYQPVFFNWFITTPHCSCFMVITS